MALDTALIKAGYAAVEPHGTAVTGYFYEHLFEHNPAVRPLFAEHIGEQRDRLWTTLGVLVAKLDDLGTVVKLLEGLGRRHVGYGALPEHYPAVGASLLAALEYFAGPEAWTSEMAAAWTELYGVVAETMIGAAAQVAAVEHELKQDQEQEQAA
ncbi:MAG TPA: globin domain-containing protein [Actinospica sp.]|nr:globin domain-containing protein [Actinospica sp.]